MGTYTELIVAGYPIISSQSAVVPEVMTIFRETDRYVLTRCVSERNVLVWGEPTAPCSQEAETVFEYSCETSKVIDRLNIMGFALHRAQREFDDGRRAKIAEYASWMEECDSSEWIAEDLRLFEMLTFDAYVAALGRIIAQGLRPAPFDDREREGLDSVTKYILAENDECWFGFLGKDIRLLLRVACEVVPKDSRVVQDVTALVHSGYYSETEPVCENAIRELVADHPENSARIILTEGSTDCAVLSEALSLLHPHLSGYYSFLDFGFSRLPGGAGQLVSIVKAFAAAGITNRIVALFDNDTAAHEATHALRAISLPPNIAVRHYPNLALLRAYPTLGPGGLAKLDVNDLAGSIELYLGEDVLRNEQHVLTPVQWKGYSGMLKRYHGEVLCKAELLTKFHSKVARRRAHPDDPKVDDWSGVSAILQEIFHAFD